MSDALVLATTDVASIRPAAAVVIPLLAASLIAVSGRRPNVREAWTVAAALCQFAIVASMVPDALAGRLHATNVGAVAPGIEFVFRADPLGMLFALVASGLYVVTGIYSIGYVRGLGEHAQTRFFAALAVSLSGAVGVAFAGNLLVLFVCYEVITIATYPLVAHEESAEARAAGYKYIAYAFSGGIVLFTGVVGVFYLAGTTAFAPSGIDALSEVDPWLGRALFGLLVAGFAVKAAVMPLHSWLPDAMVAPTPVSGLLHAVAVVKAGAFGVVRTVTDVFGPAAVADLGLGAPLAAVAGGTILLASLLALRQDDLKARLAYSTVAQLSYIVLGVALLTPAGLLGSLLHFPAHAFAKLTLFLCVGALYVETGTKKVSEVAGIGRRMPLTMAAFAVASLSMAGIPLLAGFVSKWHLLVGSAAAGGWVFLALLVVSGVLNVAYFWPIVYAAFFERPDDADPKPILDNPIGGRDEAAGLRTDGGNGEESAPHEERVGWRGDETTPLLLGPLLVTAALTVAFGLFPDHAVFLEVADAVVESVTGEEFP
jgi:multicomponent Na+:H+ antiporter subunit D